MKASISKFADDIKVTGKDPTKADCEFVKKEFEELAQWSEIWKMPFNVKYAKF